MSHYQLELVAYSELPVSSRHRIGPNDFVRPDGVHVQGMDEALMQETIDDFANAAKFMKNCGFKMVMVHGGHGWLLAQFLSPATNHRTDEYGGSIENRARFPLRVLKAMREAVGEDFIIEYRLSGDEWVRQELGRSGSYVTFPAGEDSVIFAVAERDSLRWQVLPWVLAGAAALVVLISVPVAFAGAKKREAEKKASQE